MLARELRSLVTLASEQGPQSRIYALDIVSGERGLQDAVDVFEQVVDVGCGRSRMRLVELPVGVGGADEPVPAPRTDKEHTLLGSQQQAVLRAKTVAWHNKVYSLRSPHREGGSLPHELLQVVGPYTCRVDYLLRANLERLVAHQVAGGDTHHSLTDLHETLNTHPARDVSPI